MISDFYTYFLFVVINTLDIGMLYYLVHNITSPRNKWLSVKEQTKRPSVTLKAVAFGISHSATMGFFAYFFAEEIFFRIGSILLILLIIRLITKERWGNVIIIYAIAFLFIFAIQAILIIFLQLLGISIIYIALISQMLGFIMCIYMYRYVSFYKTFIFIKNKLSRLEFLILTPFIILMSVAVYYSAGISENVFIVLILAALSLSIVVGAYMMIQYAKKLSAKSHHIASLLEGLDYLVKTINDPREIQRHYIDTLKRIEFEIPENDFCLDDHKTNIIEFIENKKMSRQVKVQIVKNVKFFCRNRNVSLPMMIYMLSTLLDNAFDTKTKKPLFVDMTVVAHQLEITVANASDKKSPTEIAQMFDDGVSSKKGNHGYGLPNLSRIVKSYKGDIVVNCDYRSEYKSHYLTITIRIKEFG